MNVSSLPGLSQLGNLVGVGVVVGAVIMLTVFAPLVLRRLRRENRPREVSVVERWVLSPRFQGAGAIATGIVVVGLLLVLSVRGGPRADFSEAPLRPRHSAAYEALDRLTQKLTDEADPLSLLVTGDSVDAVLERLRAAEAQLHAAQTRGEVKSFRSALPLWPDAARQQINLPVLAALAAEETRLAEAARTAGFEDEAFDLTRRVLRQWAKWATDHGSPIWPSNGASRWILSRAVREDHGKWYALGLVTPTPGRETALLGAVSGPGLYLTGWKLLSVELRGAIPREFARAIIGIAVVVLGLLVVAFRDVRSVGLFVVATGLVFACLQGAMTLLGITWNFFNLAAILLLLGTGTDYSILFLLALRRNGGDVPAARRELFVVICLCACSASAGFGTISWANHLGLASLGQTCALGLLLDAAISVFLLPLAWSWVRGRAATGPLTDMSAPEIAGIAPFFMVKDAVAALTFYRDKLGFEITYQEPAHDPFFGLVTRGSAMLILKSVGVDPQPNSLRAPDARWDAYLYVPDPDALAAEFASRHVEFATPLKDTHEGLRGFEIKDPDGYVLFFGCPKA